MQIILPQNLNKQMILDLPDFAFDDADAMRNAISFIYGIKLTEEESDTVIEWVDQFLGIV